MITKSFRLSKHADFQRVYKASRKQFSKQMTYFFAVRPGPTDAQPRIGLTVGKVLGNAVARNRIKRRMRAAVRQHLCLLGAPVDVILHPRTMVLELDYTLLQREVAQIFRSIDKAVQR